MLLATLTTAFLLSAPQVPVHEGPEAPKPEAQATSTDGFANFWKLQSKLVGGEWQVDEHFFKKSFHRFVNGPGNTSLFVETRNREDLFQPLPGLSVIFPDPNTGKLRGIEIGDHGAFSDSVFDWKGEMLIRRYTYHLSDGSMRDGKLQETKMDLESHWSFEGKSAYRWELFQKTPAGMSMLLETSFAHQETLTTLPKSNEDEVKPSVALNFLDPLHGNHASSGKWHMKADWRVKGMGLWIQRSMPNPNFGWSKDAPEVLEVSGFYYWNPLEMTAKFIGFSKEGALVEGVTQLNKRKQIESTYSVGPAVANKSAKTGNPNPFGEQIQANEDGSLQVTWVSIGKDGKPAVTEATLK